MEEAAGNDGFDLAEAAVGVPDHGGAAAALGLDDAGRAVARGGHLEVVPEKGIVEAEVPERVAPRGSLAVVELHVNVVHDVVFRCLLRGSSAFPPRDRRPTDGGVAAVESPRAPLAGRAPETPPGCSGTLCCRGLTPGRSRRRRSLPCEGRYRSPVRGRRASVRRLAQGARAPVRRTARRTQIRRASLSPPRSLWLRREGQFPGRGMDCRCWKELRLGWLAYRWEQSRSPRSSAAATRTLNLYMASSWRIEIRTGGSGRSGRPANAGPIGPRHL